MFLLKFGYALLAFVFRNFVALPMIAFAVIVFMLFVACCIVLIVGLIAVAVIVAAVLQSLWNTAEAVRDLFKMLFSKEDSPNGKARELQ